MGQSRSSVSNLPEFFCLPEGGSDPYCIHKTDVCLSLLICWPAHTLTPRCSLISKPEMHLKLSFQDLEAFLIRLSVCKRFQGHVTLWNHGIKIIAFEMKEGSCALHQKFLLVLINPVYKCHGLHPQGVYIEFLAVSVSLTLQNKCRII